MNGPKGDEQEQEEQRETGELLKRLLDEDRPAYRRLFSYEVPT
jgi:hypothetical protein